MNLFYVQNIERGYVGNSLVWWKKGYRGYTCDIREAHVWTETEIEDYPLDLDEDVPWPKAYIDEQISFHIDRSVSMMKQELEQWQDG